MSIGPKPAFDVVEVGTRPDSVKVDTALSRYYGLSAEESSAVVQRALLNAAGVNQRLHLMQLLNCITGLQEVDFPAFERKLRFLFNQVNPELQERRFNRLVTLGGFPELSNLPAGTHIDAGRVLKLRNLEECVDFRHWLRSIDEEDDATIQARFESASGRIADLLESAGGHTLRFAVTTGVGFIPVVGGVAGPVVSAADTFLLDRFIGHPGPVTFLSRHYRSLF